MHMRTLLKRLASTRDERGFTILLAVYVLTITSLLLGAAYIAVLNDTGLSRNDLDQKRAYAAAQAGIAQYSYDLNQHRRPGRLGRQRLDRVLLVQDAPGERPVELCLGDLQHGDRGHRQQLRRNLSGQRDGLLKPRVAHDRRAVQPRELP